MEFFIVFALVFSTVYADTEHILPAVKPQGRIINGLSVPTGEIPYQVGLLLQIDEYKYRWCGGALISHEWVLTAAHCTEDVYEATVYLGSTTRQSAEVSHKVTKQDIIIHNEWNTITLRNDISLIKIPVTKYSTKIQPVKLPPLTDSNKDYIKEKVVASGWGNIADYKTGGTEYLQWARMKVMSNFDCGRYFKITSSQICVETTNGFSTCKGDSGGPLVLESSKILVGITSFGAQIGCTKGIPNVFTRVTSYLQWIRTNTGIYS